MMSNDKLLNLMAGIAIAAVAYPFGILWVCIAVCLAAVCVPLWIFCKARRNNGIAELPSMLMFV